MKKIKIRIYKLSKDVDSSVHGLSYKETLKMFFDVELPAEMYELVFEGPVDYNELKNIIKNFDYNGIKINNSDVVEVIHDNYNQKGDFYFNENGKIIKINFNGSLSISRLKSLKDRLHYRVSLELDHYVLWLKAQPAEKIFDEAHKLTFMREIYEIFTGLLESGCFETNTLRRLYNIDCILEDLYTSWLSNDISLEIPLEASIDNYIEYVLPEIINENTENEEKSSSCVYTDEVFTPSSYCKKFFGICVDDHLIPDELREWLDNNGHDDLWDYPISEIDHIIENNSKVVLVDGSYINDEGKLIQSLRWFEIPVNPNKVKI